MHVLMPNMAFACGETVLTDDRPYLIGVTEKTWGDVGCPDCKAQGLAYIRARIAWQQGHGPDPNEAPAPEHSLHVVGDQLDLFGVA